MVRLLRTVKLPPHTALPVSIDIEVGDPGLLHIEPHTGLPEDMRVIESMVNDGPDTIIMVTNTGDRWVTPAINRALEQATPSGTFWHMDDLLKLRSGISDPV